MMQFLCFVLLLLATASKLPKMALAVSFRPVDPKYAVPDSYAVGLSPGQTLDSHWEAIGVNISAVAEEFDTLFSVETGLFYYFKSADKAVFDAVLRDPLVNSFDQDQYVPLDQLEPDNGPSFRIDDQGRPIYGNETESIVD